MVVGWNAHIEIDPSISSDFNQHCDAETTIHSDLLKIAYLSRINNPQNTDRRHDIESDSRLSILLGGEAVPRSGMGIVNGEEVVSVVGRAHHGF